MRAAPPSPTSARSCFTCMRSIPIGKLIRIAPDTYVCADSKACDHAVHTRLPAWLQ